MVMTTLGDADAIATLYKATYPEDTSHGSDLAQQFAGEYQELKRLVLPLRASLAEFSEEDKVARDVKLPGGTASDKLIVQVAHDIAASDMLFGSCSREEIERVVTLGDVLREARLAGVPMMGLGTNVAGIRKEVKARKGWLQTRGQAADEDDDDEEEVDDTDWEVLEIRASRMKEGVKQYKVVWKNGDPPCTWEPKSNLVGCESLLRAFERKKNRTKGPAASLEEDEEESRGSKELDTKVGKLVSSLTRLSEENASFTRDVKKALASKHEDLSDEEEEDEEGMRLRRDRPLLKGHSRLADVGFVTFKRERELARRYKMARMKAGAPFATQFNEALADLQEAEEAEMEQDEVVERANKKLRLSPENEVLRDRAVRAQAKQSCLHDAWMVCEDKVTYLQELSTLAEEGKVAKAWKMFEMMKRSKKADRWKSEFRKIGRMAEAELKREAEADRALGLSMQLGATSSLMESQEAKQAVWAVASQGQTGGYGYGQRNMMAYGVSQGGVSRPLPSVPPPPPPSASWSGSSGGQGRSTGDDGSSGTGQYGRSGTAGVQRRTMFKTAEEVLGNRCPQAARGHMVPVGMKFFSQKKLLTDPPKVRPPGQPFSYKCKLCDKPGHEAFECEETFEVDSKPGLNYRALMRLGVVDQHGQYQ